VGDLYHEMYLPSPSLCERRRYCGVQRLSRCVCVSAALVVSTAKVMRCIQWSLFVFFLTIKRFPTTLSCIKESEKEERSLRRQDGMGMGSWDHGRKGRRK